MIEKRMCGRWVEFTETNKLLEKLKGILHHD